MSASSKLPPFDPADPLGIDDLLEPEDLAVRSTVRDWAADRVVPSVAEWYETGELPGIRELARELGEIGALGMSLSGYGCAGASAVQVGTASFYNPAAAETVLEGITRALDEAGVAAVADFIGTARSNRA